MVIVRLISFPQLFGNVVCIMLQNVVMPISWKEEVRWSCAGYTFCGK